MEKSSIDVYLIPMDDFHQSEYVSDYFRTIEFISGFTGDSCNIVVTKDSAKLFTDGRYFIQAEQELSGSGVDLMKMGTEGVPDLTEYIESVLPDGGVLACDGRCVNFSLFSELQDLALRRNAALDGGVDLVGKIWKDRPALPVHPVFVLDTRWCGVSAEEKLAALRKEMEETGADLHLITSLDDIAWILNLRGNDIPCNPVFLSYLLLDRDKGYLFAEKEDFSDEVRKYLKGLNITLQKYDAVYDAVAQLRDRTVLLESGKTNSRLIMLLDESMKVVDEMLPSSRMKAKKNETEIRNEKAAHVKDGLALTRFFYFLKHAYGVDGKLTEEAKKILGSDKLTECNAADYLEKLRKQQEGFLELSFPTISAYGANAALPHYAPDREHDVEIKPSGLYLVDSGGQYYEGTTDVTRTFAMGPITEEEKTHFTWTLMAMLRLGDVQFLKGSCGVTLDYAAREVFWRHGLNFNHGTGHGVGYLLNVHERPNGIRYRLVPERMDSAEFEPGYITSDEPGLYIAGRYGIRLENLILCEKAFTNEYGEWMKFSFLTMCPIDMDAVDLTLMEKHDIELLNSYHAMVREALSPFLKGPELQWLQEATRAV